jgi:hypothetical protein
MALTPGYNRAVAVVLAAVQMGVHDRLVVRAAPVEMALSEALDVEGRCAADTVPVVS